MGAADCGEAELRCTHVFPRAAGVSFAASFKCPPHPPSPPPPRRAWTVLEARLAAISGFKGGTKDVLVATDVASKGLDFPGVQHVINYDMPDEIENYVHRRAAGGLARGAGRWRRAIVVQHRGRSSVL